MDSPWGLDTLSNYFVAGEGHWRGAGSSSHPHPSGRYSTLVPISPPPGGIRPFRPATSQQGYHTQNFPCGHSSQAQGYYLGLQPPDWLGGIRSHGAHDMRRVSFFRHSPQPTLTRVFPTDFPSAHREGLQDICSLKRKLTFPSKFRPPLTTGVQFRGGGPASSASSPGVRRIF